MMCIKSTHKPHPGFICPGMLTAQCPIVCWILHLTFKLVFAAALFDFFGNSKWISLERFCGLNKLRKIPSIYSCRREARKTRSVDQCQPCLLESAMRCRCKFKKRKAHKTFVMRSAETHVPAHNWTVRVWGGAKVFETHDKAGKLAIPCTHRHSSTDDRTITRRSRILVRRPMQAGKPAPLLALGGAKCTITKNSGGRGGPVPQGHACVRRGCCEQCIYSWEMRTRFAHFPRNDKQNGHTTVVAADLFRWEDNSLRVACGFRSDFCWNRD